MSRTNPTVWSYTIDLEPFDKQRVRLFAAEELRYYNALVLGLSGPMRTMPATLASMTKNWETLFGLAAAYQINPITTKAAKLPEVFASHSSLLEAADTKQSLLFDVAASAATLAYQARRAMAVEMLAFMREQSEAYANTLSTGDSVYRYVVQTLSPLEPVQKRHIQLPRSAIKIEKIDRNEVALKLPYLKNPVVISTPPTNWTMLILREEHDGRFVLELHDSPHLYDLKRTDASGFNRRSKRKSKRGDHRGQYSMPV